MFWALFWCPLANVRNTLTAISYNLGMALFVSTQFDVETYLADLSTYFGCFYAGLYIVMYILISVAAVYYAEVYHSWDQYLNEEDMNGKGQEEEAEDINLAEEI